MCDFYFHPAAFTARTDELKRHFQQCVIECGTEILAIDDIHFLLPHTTEGRPVSDLLKQIMSELPLTLVLAGVGLVESGLFTEGPDTPSARARTQLGVRLTPVPLEHLKWHSNSGEWRRCLLRIEADICLANHQPGDIADLLSDYLYEHSNNGTISNLMQLINLGCREAIRCGDERLTLPLMEHCRKPFADRSSQ